MPSSVSTLLARDGMLRLLVIIQPPVILNELSGTVYFVYSIWPHVYEGHYTYNMLHSTLLAINIYQSVVFFSGNVVSQFYLLFVNEQLQHALLSLQAVVQRFF